MAIVIFDNGKDYSDHTVYFVDTGTVSAAVAMPVFAKAKGCFGYNPHVIGVAADVAWCEPGQTMTIKKFIDYCTHPDDCAAEESYYANPCDCWLSELLALASRSA